MDLLKKRYVKLFYFILLYQFQTDLDGFSILNTSRFKGRWIYGRYRLLFPICCDMYYHIQLQTQENVSFARRCIRWIKAIQSTSEQQKEDIRRYSGILQFRCSRIYVYTINEQGYNVRTCSWATAAIQSLIKNNGECHRKSHLFFPERGCGGNQNLVQFFRVR